MSTSAAGTVSFSPQHDVVAVPQVQHDQNVVWQLALHGPWLEGLVVL